MKTESLIKVLATGLEAVAASRLRRRLAFVQAVGVLVSLVLCITALKLNPHLGHEMEYPPSGSARSSA